jgi:NAD(P)H-hydrate epimerase
MHQPQTLSNALYSAEATRRIEKKCLAAHNMPSAQLMTRAAHAAITTLQDYWPSITTLHVFCGAGNNGGDGYTMAALAAKRGLQTIVWQVSPQKDNQPYQYAVQEGVVIKQFSLSDWQTELLKPKTTPIAQVPVIVDALLGIGSQGALRESFALAVKAINEAPWPVFALDIPTGINADTGTYLCLKEPAVKAAIKADATISFITRKLGNFVGEGRNHAGKMFFSDLDVVDDNALNLNAIDSAIEDPIKPLAHIIDYNIFVNLLPPRAGDAHKGSFGHVLVIGGDQGLGGAPLMAAQMAARTGAGLVGVATAPVNTASIIARQPELMAVGVTSGQALLPLLKKPSVFVIGPGLGQSAWSEQLLYIVLKEINANKKCVIDADALNLLAAKKLSLPRQLIADKDAAWVLTPHPGEAARLLDTSIEAVQADRLAAIYALQNKYGGTVVLKGAGTLVLTSNQQLFVCNAGNPGMATGGMGDVLSGLIGGLLAQGLTPANAACLGVVLHAMAGDLAVAESGMRGLLATDLIPYVRLLLDNNVNV